MSRSLFIFVIFVVLAFYAENTSAGWACWTIRKTGASQFGCYGLGKLSELDKAPTNVNFINFHTSELTYIPGNVFYRFRYTLKSVDLHNAGIQTIDSKAFNGLTNLRNLTLWGNKLEVVYANWFSNLTQLRFLDVSFNRITYIEETTFTLLPNLEYLYMDYNNMVSLNWNVFTYLGNLKKVKLGKNPWDWWYRAQITRQLTDQHVDYSSEWDDYDWINHVVWNCVENHGAKNDDDSVLDCASAYFIQEHSKITTDFGKRNFCGQQSRALYDCAVRSDPLKNVTITPKIAVRKILQGFFGAFNSLRNPDATFAYRSQPS